ncbi:MAG: TorF family putative porin [Sedimenticola sp.]
MKLKKLSITCGLVLAGLSSVASAESGFSGNVALTSDYIFRGLTQNDGDAAIQGGFDYAHDSGFYAGVWASNVSEASYTDSSMELDLYLGWGGDFNGVSVDVGVLHYEYPGTSVEANNTDEYHVGVGYDFGAAAVSATYNYSPDFYGADEATYLDLGIEVPAGPVTIAAHYGMTDYDAASGDDYDDWSVGVSTEYGGFGFDLSYYETDGVSGGDDDALVFTISKSL